MKKERYYIVKKEMYPGCVEYVGKIYKNEKHMSIRITTWEGSDTTEIVYQNLLEYKHYGKGGKKIKKEDFFKKLSEAHENLKKQFEI